MPQASKNTFQNLDDIQDQLQILPNGFSVDYRNKIQVLYTKLRGIPTGGDEVYTLPLYEGYVQGKIDGFQQSFLAIDLRDIYMQSISYEDIKGFNAQVEKINGLVLAGTENDVIKEACNELMEAYLTPTQEPIFLSTTLAEVLGVLKSGK